MKCLRKLVARFRRREEGSATVEFVLLFPMFMVIVISGFESGMLLTRQMMLERGLDITMRSLRLGAIPNPTHDVVKQRICDTAMIIPSCMTVVQLEMRPVDLTTWNVPIEGYGCIDRTSVIAPVINFSPGMRNELMMVRACAVFDPIFPTFALGTNLPLDSSGGYRLAAVSAFVNEP